MMTLLCWYHWVWLMEVTIVMTIDYDDTWYHWYYWCCDDIDDGIDDDVIPSIVEAGVALNLIDDMVIRWWLMCCDCWFVVITDDICSDMIHCWWLLPFVGPMVLVTWCHYWYCPIPGWYRYGRNVDDWYLIPDIGIDCVTRVLDLVDWRLLLQCYGDMVLLGMLVILDCWW